MKIPARIHIIAYVSLPKPVKREYVKEVAKLIKKEMIMNSKLNYHFPVEIKLQKKVNKPYTKIYITIPGDWFVDDSEEYEKRKTESKNRDTKNEGFSLREILLK